jgi:hypothetical protein
MSGWLLREAHCSAMEGGSTSSGPREAQKLFLDSALLAPHHRLTGNCCRPRASLTPTGCSRCPSISPSHNALFHHVFSTVCGAGFTHLAWAMLVEGSLRAPGLQRAGCAPAPAPAPGIIRLPHPAGAEPRHPLARALWVPPRHARVGCARQPRWGQRASGWCGHRPQGLSSPAGTAVSGLHRGASWWRSLRTVGY